MSINAFPLIYYQSLLVACFACNATRQDSILLTFATNIYLSVISYSRCGLCYSELTPVSVSLPVGLRYEAWWLLLALLVSATLYLGNNKGSTYPGSCKVGERTHLYLKMLERHLGKQGVTGNRMLTSYCHQVNLYVLLTVNVCFVNVAIKLYMLLELWVCCCSLLDVSHQCNWIQLFGPFDRCCAQLVRLTFEVQITSTLYQPYIGWIDWCVMH